LNLKSTRENIVETADRLFYERGYEHTSFADVAHAVGISRGNFYHHFKSKDDILIAVIGVRIANTRRMLESWEAADAPAARIRSFFDMLIANRSPIMRHGCPVGSLCAELAKLDHVAQYEARQLFSLFREWLGRQFAQLGRSSDADSLALHVLARSQGIAQLANVFHDEAFIRREVEFMHGWLSALLAST